MTRWWNNLGLCKFCPYRHIMNIVIHSNKPENSFHNIASEINSPIQAQFFSRILYFLSFQKSYSILVTLVFLLIINKIFDLRFLFCNPERMSLVCLCLWKLFYYFFNTIQYCFQIVHTNDAYFMDVHRISYYLFVL